MSTTPAAAAEQPAPQPHAHHRAFGRAYWMLNAIEMFERLAYFGIRAVVPLYIMQATEPGGLHLTAADKGMIYAWWAVFQSILPIFTGGIADRYGYKRVLCFAISTNAIGYLMMANLHNKWGFFAAIIVLATGTAFFKPSLQGSIAQSLTKANSSMGWGIFYWVVNVGAVAAPFISTAILGKPHSLAGWQTLFYTCAGFTCVNLLLLLTFKDVPSGASKTETPWQVLKRTVVNIVEPRLVVWLLIMSCFWLMMYQLWDLHPNFITDWIDSSDVARRVHSDHWPWTLFWEYGDRGRLQVPQQILLNLNATLIVLLMVPMSWMARKMRTLSAMLVGMSVATCGVLVAGLTNSGWVFLLGVVFFSLGEMWTGPKKNEYLGLIAPPGKKALYLGYVNIPVGIGLFVGSYLAGWLYNNWGEKATLALKELGSDVQVAARAARATDWSDGLDKLPELLEIDRSEAFAHAQAHLAAEDPQAAAARLRADFRYDQGQVTNLAYLCLAEHEPYAAAVSRGLAEVTGSDPPPDEPIDLNLAARYVHRLPNWTGRHPIEVLEIAAELLSAEAGSADLLERSEVIAELWRRYGTLPEVLNNLALEYLAQATSLLDEAVARALPWPLSDPVEEIPKQLGIDRQRAFAALSAAMAGGEQTLTRSDEELYVYLIGRPHLRYNAVAERDWTRDVGFLRQMIASDPAAMKVVQAQIDRLGPWDRLTGSVGRLLGRDAGSSDLFVRLAGRQELIQKALDAKDWSRSPQQAACLLQLNPYEARALAAAEMAETPQRATLLLWEKYRPQYAIWIPIAAIGIAATIALGIFGQMAKRWQDMNA